MVAIFPRCKSMGGWVSAVHLFYMPSGCHSVLRFPRLVLCPHCCDNDWRQAGWRLPCMCACAWCARVLACLVESQAKRRGGTVGNRRGGAGELGRGALSLLRSLSLLDLVASLSLSLYLFCSASLTVVHRILHCKFMAPP